LALHPLPEFSHLARQILLHMFPPNETAGAILVWAFVQPSQLLAPFPNQRVKPYQLGLKLRRSSLFAIHHDKFKTIIAGLVPFVM
jgi:hypothetical protein